MSSTLTLRKYQQEAHEHIEAEWDLGTMRQAVVMATGLGKTAVAVTWAERWKQAVEGRLTNKRRILWLTHRDELVQQTIKAFDLWWPNATFDLGIVKAERNETSRDIVIASVQTLARENRLADLLASEALYGGFGLVISDEHHHSVSPTWAGVLDALQCGSADGPLMIGLTATPNRADGVGLKATTDKIVFERDTVWSIANGYLVPPKGRSIAVDLSTVKVSGGDYQPGSLGDVMQAQGAHALVGELVTRYASDRKVVIFCPTIAFAELVTLECVLAGHSSEMVQADTPLDERQRMYARLRNGTTRVIVNCGVLTEGFDEPSLDCVIVARPTRSESLFAQMVGRGLRLYPGKTDCLVICLAGTERHKLATLSSLAGRSWADAMKAREMEEQGEFDFAEELDRVIEEEAKRANLKTKAIDLLAAARRKITWAAMTNDSSTFAKKVVPDDRDNKDAQPVVVFKRSSQIEDLWRVVVMRPTVDPRSKWPVYVPDVRLTDVDFNTAQSHADDLIRRMMSANLLRPDAPWRKKPVSDKQKDVLRSKNLPVKDGLTAGEASDMLDVVFLKRTAAMA